MEKGTGSFLLSEKTRLYTNLQGGEAKLWEKYLKALPVQLKEARKKDRKQMLFLLITPKTTQLPSPESYTLSVTSQRIEIRATSGAGLFYGMQTLLQLMQPASTGSYSVPSVEIEDTPRFAYRGLMLDVSRHFSTKEFIKKQIDALAYYKINRLHLHLTDAAGWRLEIKKYPLLTDFAAWRTDPTWKKWWNGGRKYLRYDEPGASGGYYTQDDIREILEYARQHYITMIPEIEMPSHSEEVLAAYPQLSCSGEPYKNSDFCVGNEETFTFLENVLTEVMELFPSEYIHVGGDEAGKSAWKTCPKCQKRMKDEHLANVDELQSYLDAAYGKTEQLKRLTDELFRYSLLFGCKELPLQLERYDASILLGQLLGESRAQLQQQGFTVQLLLPQQDVQIEADVTYLKRVFDNLFDNIRKYADPARPVAIAALLEDGALHVCLSNSVNPGAGRIESNKIGLRTCAKIMAQMSGSFKRYTESGKFTAEVILPILPAGDPDGSS